MFAFANDYRGEERMAPRETYGPAARRAWLALTTYLDANGDIGSVCEGTGKKNDYQYYIDRAAQDRRHARPGAGPVCATALLR